MDDREPRWTAGGPDVDLADPALYADDGYQALWRKARENHPIAWTESPRVGGLWSITGYAAGSRVVKHADAFSSAQGMRLGGSAAAVRAAAGRMLVVSDGEQHRRIRTAFSAWFTGRAVASLRDRLETHVDELVRRLAAEHRVIDVVTELATAIPTFVLFEMLDIPASDREELAGITAAAFDDADESDAGAARRAGAHARVFGYFDQLLRRRRKEPGQDILSSLASADTGGKRLTDPEILLNCDGLMNGGLETTPHAISGATLALARQRDAWERLKADPGSVDGAVDEILRFTSPGMHVMRTATEDVEIDGARVRAGDRVVVWLPSCNWDESVFPQPDRLRFDRRGGPHLSLGAGPHYCIGAVLAKMELRCWLEAMLRHVAAVEVAGSVARQASTFLNGLSRLEVTLAVDGRAG
jgi:cytochrome P450